MANGPSIARSASPRIAGTQRPCSHAALERFNAPLQTTDVGLFGLIDSGALQPERLSTDTLPLQDINRAMATLENTSKVDISVIKQF